MQLGVHDLSFWPPEESCGWVLGRVLDGELEVRSNGMDSLRWCGGQSEAAGFGNAWNMDIEPLAGEELIYVRLCVKLIDDLP